MESSDEDEYEGLATIIDIPEEILEHILSLLSPYRDYKAAMHVCKQWRRVMLGAIQQQYQLFHRAVKEGSTAWSSLLPETGATISERYAHTACYHDKSMYVFGGCTSTSTTFNDLWRFDLATRQWIRPLAIGTYPSPKACATLLTYGRNLILFGGWSHPSPYPLHQAARFFNQLHMYTPSTNRWSLLTTRTSPPPTAGHSASILGDRMIVFGGSHGYGVSCNELWVLEMMELNWYKKEVSPPLPQPRYGQSQIVLDSAHLLIIGGCGGPNMQFTDVWMLTIDENNWKWKEIKIINPEFSPPQLWCHPACKVGDKVVVLSKSNKVSLREPVLPHPSVQPVTTPPRSSKLWIPPRQDEVDMDMASCQDCVVVSNSQDKAPSSGGSGSFKRRLLDTSESSQESSSDSEDVMPSSSSMCADPERRFVSSHSTENMSTSPGDGASARAGTSSSASSDSQLHTSPVRPGMPSIRPNAMKNRQRQLETLRLYEERFKNASLKSKAGCNHVGRKLPREGHMTTAGGAGSVSTQPMHLHVLDVSRAVSDSVVSWQPIRQNIGHCAPEETIFYSLVEGRGELVLFGGIQTDLSSMQRGMNVNQQKVSNEVHFIQAVKTLL